MASVDTPEENLKFAQQEMANFPMLSDPSKSTATAYGVLNKGGVANRWTFYIAPNGTIAYIDKNVNALAAFADRHVILEKGRTVWMGTSAELMADTSLKDRYLHV